MNPIRMMAQLGLLSTILQSTAILMGLCLFMGGLFTLKKYGETRTFMSHQMTLATPLVMILCATVLLLLPGMIKTALFAFWGDASPERYIGSMSGIDQYIPVVLMFVRLVGVGAFMRGIMLFSKAGHSGGQQGFLGRAMIHTLGGLLCIHILGTVTLLKRILDLY